MRSAKRKPGRDRQYSRAAVCCRCGKAFDRYPGKQKNERTFCSRACYHAQLAEDNLSRRVNQRGGMTVEEREKISRCARERQGNNGRTYEKTLGRHTHRVVMEQLIGRPLLPGEVVHHIDCDIRNNDPKNLMLFASQADHAKWHAESNLQRGGDPFRG